MKEFLMGLFGGMTLCTIIGNFTIKPEREEMKRQAIAHGAAEWVVDQKTGNTTFKWKETK